MGKKKRKKMTEGKSQQDKFISWRGSAREASGLMENGLPQINNWNKIIIVIDIDKLDD